MPTPSNWTRYGDIRDILPPGMQNDTSYMRQIAKQNLSLYSGRDSTIYRAIRADAQELLLMADKLDSKRQPEEWPGFTFVVVLLAIVAFGVAVLI